MEPEDQLPCTNKLAICTCSKPHQSSPYLKPILKIHFNIISHLRLGITSFLFTSGLLTQSLYTIILSPIVPQPRPFHFSWFDPLNTIWRRRFSLCILIHSPVTSSLLGPTIFLSTLSYNALNLWPDINRMINSIIRRWVGPLVWLKLNRKYAQDFRWIILGC